MGLVYRQWTLNRLWDWQKFSIHNQSSTEVPNGMILSRLKTQNRQLATEKKSGKCIAEWILTEVVTWWSMWIKGLWHFSNGTVLCVIFWERLVLSQEIGRRVEQFRSYCISPDTNATDLAVKPPGGLDSRVPTVSGGDTYSDTFAKYLASKSNTADARYRVRHSPIVFHRLGRAQLWIRRHWSLV